MTTSGRSGARGRVALRRRLAGLEVAREFPWRETRDPWRVLIAEMCCQQTQAARAIDAYERCCAAFPTPRACADAPLSDVIHAWRGLGYYRRAVALHDAAGAIVARHGGRVPDQLDELLALPGVGPYTARAVLAFAFERDVGIVDTNVARILSRAVANARLSARDAQRLADDLVPPGEGWRHNQAMLDLGALHCRARPACATCPVRPACSWRRAGPHAPDPSVRSAGVSGPQPRFDGSDRQARGRLLAAAMAGPVRLSEVAAAAGWPAEPARASRAADGLIADGLLVVRRETLVLSGRTAPVPTPRGS